MQFKLLLFKHQQYVSSTFHIQTRITKIPLLSKGLVPVSESLQDEKRKGTKLDTEDLGGSCSELCNFVA